MARIITKELAIKIARKALKSNCLIFMIQLNLSFLEIVFCSPVNHKPGSHTRYMFSASLSKSSLNLGWARLMMSNALSRVDFPFRLTTPYSVAR